MATFVPVTVESKGRVTFLNIDLVEQVELIHESDSGESGDYAMKITSQGTPRIFRYNTYEEWVHAISAIIGLENIQSIPNHNPTIHPSTPLPQQDQEPTSSIQEQDHNAPHAIATIETPWG
jgi:hypothetical protein